MSPTQSLDLPSIAGFWRRIAAFTLDALTLGLIGLAIGAVLGYPLASLGPWGRLLGFFVALTYFGFFNSRLAGGQTPGKRLLKIKVVDAQGAPLSAKLSLLRFLPIGAAWFLNNAQLPASILLSPWASVLALGVLGLGLCLIYLFIFNRGSRQSLHDLMVGSFVVPTASSGSLAPALAGRPARVHLAICTVLLGLAAFTPLFTQQLGGEERFAQLSQVFRAVNAEPWVHASVVNQGKTYTSSAAEGSRSSSHLSITAFSKDADIANESRARKLAFLALTTLPSARQLDLVQITIVHGYDIGIASAWRSHKTVRTPAQWLTP